MGDGSHSGTERSGTPKGTRNEFRFGKTVSVSNTSLRADMAGISQCVRSVASEDSAFTEVVMEKSFTDDAWMPCLKEPFDRTSVTDAKRRNEAPRRVVVSGNRALLGHSDSIVYF